MMTTSNTLAPYTADKNLPRVVDRNDSTRKRKANVALGSPAGSPLKHGGRLTDSSNAGYLRGKGIDEYDLDGLCIFDSLGIEGLTMCHDDNGEAHLVISSSALSSVPLKMTHRHIIWGSHYVFPVVALPWQEGTSAGVTTTAAADDKLSLSIADGDVDWLAEGVFDALLDGFEDNDHGLDGFDLSPPATTDEASTIVSTDAAVSPMWCDFYEIWPYLDVDRDLGQDLSFDEI